MEFWCNSVPSKLVNVRDALFRDSLKDHAADIVVEVCKEKSSAFLEDWILRGLKEPGANRSVQASNYAAYLGVVKPEKRLPWIRSLGLTRNATLALEVESAP